MNKPVTTPEENINVEEFMARYDRESDYRRFRGFGKWVVALLAISFSCFSFTPQPLGYWMRTYSEQFTWLLP